MYIPHFYFFLFCDQKGPLAKKHGTPRKFANSSVTPSGGLDTSWESFFLGGGVECCPKHHKHTILSTEHCGGRTLPDV